MCAYGIEAPLTFTATAAEVRVHVGQSKRPPLYWIDAEGGTLYRLVGADVERLAPSLQNANSLTVDAAGGKLYWTTQTGNGTGEIHSAALDGTNEQRVKAPKIAPLDIAIDTARQKLYWINSRGNIQPQDTRGIRVEITPTEEGNPGHGSGTRSVYINGIGVAALKDDTRKTFPTGTLIIKEVNNNTKTFVQHVASMTKTDDPASASHNGWFYSQYTREAETAKFVAVAGAVPGSTSEDCHACHIQAPKDSVFTQLPNPDTAVEEGPPPPNLNQNPHKNNLKNRQRPRRPLKKLMMSLQNPNVHTEVFGLTASLSCRPRISL